MALFSRGRSGGSSARDRWESGPVLPGEWAKYAAPPPDSLEVIAQAIDRSGVNAGEVDRVEALVAVWRLISGIGQELLAKNPEASEGLKIVAGRPDMSDELIWNYFTHWDSVGIAARNHLIEEYFDSGRVADVIGSMIGAGDMRLGLGGSERVGADGPLSSVGTLEPITDPQSSLQGSDRVEGLGGSDRV